MKQNTNKVICLNSKGGVGGIQPSLQDRVYTEEGVSCAVTTADFFMPYYLIRVDRRKKHGKEWL